MTNNNNNTNNTLPTEAEALEALRAYSVFGNVSGVSRTDFPSGVTVYTGWIGGALYSSTDGVNWHAVDALWRTA